MVIPSKSSDLAFPTEESIRDPNDRPFLRAALFADADVLLTGAKDFMEFGLTKPLIMTPAEFLEHQPQNPMC